MAGGIAVIASIVRLYAIWVYTTTKDVAYDAIFVSKVEIPLKTSCSRPIQILLLSQIEVNIAIISASAPALRPLLSKTFMSISYNESTKNLTGYGSARSSNIFASHRTRSSGQIELHPFSENHHVKQKPIQLGGTHNQSEERILVGEGITKTIETRVHFEQDCHKDSARTVASPF